MPRHAILPDWPPPDYVLKGVDYLSQEHACVYAWCRGRRWLYVGVTACAVKRLYNHDVINVLELVHARDRIETWFVSNMQEALQIEQLLILKHKPKYNVAGNPGVKIKRLRTIRCPRCKHKFKQTRVWQKYCGSCRRRGGKYERDDR